MYMDNKRLKEQKSNTEEIRLNKLSNAQRFYIFQNITKDLKEISEDYICDYSLSYSIK